MSGFKGNKLDERLSAAANAKKAMLEKFRSRPGPDDPAVREREAERKAIAEARAVRAAERQAAREAEAARQAELEAARRAEEVARLAAEATAKTEEAARQRALLAEQKAARDARYARRKARR
jgi:hypothetical protein